MTLHWWMHWFWVTTLLLLIPSSERSQAAPQSEELLTIPDVVTSQPRLSERQGRAMYFPKTPPTVTSTTLAPTNVTQPKILNTNATETAANTSEISHPSLQWTPINSTESTPNVTTLAPTVANVTDGQNATFTKKRNLTRPDFVKEDTSLEGVAESRIVTEKPLSLETTFLQTRLPNIESSRQIIDQPRGGMDTGAIAGICFAALVLTALAGSTAFVLYRRRYLNKPQTLNDKCSNPDSSGYLDDSTIRDNSEEMYSLDNDSFLNSLEAMTIQNYWTDTVKHTKL